MLRIYNANLESDENVYAFSKVVVDGIIGRTSKLRLINTNLCSRLEKTNTTLISI
jgi:hypothetical protein